MNRQFLLGAGFAMMTMCIWSGWLVVSRLGTTHSLSAMDITFIRFAVAGVLALPIAWHYRKILLAAPKHLLALMVIGAGAPYVLVASIGFEYAPAAHGVLLPGTMPLFVALLSWVILKEQFSLNRMIGYAFLVTAITYRLITHDALGRDAVLADGCFLFAAFMWGIYTLSHKAAGLPSLSVMAIICIGSLLFYSIPYAVIEADRLPHFPMDQVWIQAGYQGVLTSLVGLLFYNRAIAYIGPSRASAFAASIPVIATTMSYFILGEVPVRQDYIFIGVLTLGVLFATGTMSRLIPIRPPAPLPDA